MVSRDLAALSLRSINAGGMEGALADFAWRADCDRHRRGDRFMNPGLNSAVNAGMASVATPFFFYLLAGLAIGSGLLVITRGNAVHSALAPILTPLDVTGV